MRQLANPSFWQSYDKLPDSVQKLADRNFEILKIDPHHPSLHLKKVGKYWSVRVGRKHRALAIETNKGPIWFWIGSHSEYDKLIKTT